MRYGQKSLAMVNSAGLNVSKQWGFQRQIGDHLGLIGPTSTAF
jgi:hypothetical protein